MTAERESQATARRRRERERHEAAMAAQEVDPRTLGTDGDGIVRTGRLRDAADRSGR